MRQLPWWLILRQGQQKVTVDQFRWYLISMYRIVSDDPASPGMNRSDIFTYWEQITL